MKEQQIIENIDQMMEISKNREGCSWNQESECWETNKKAWFTEALYGIGSPNCSIAIQIIFRDTLGISIKKRN